jgi:hypothetical protein
MYKILQKALGMGKSEHMQDIFISGFVYKTFGYLKQKENHLQKMYKS